MQTPLQLSVILPVHNEEGILLDAAARFSAAFDSIAGRGRWEFVFVENGSTDGSGEIIRTILQNSPGKCVTLPAGDYGNALREGILNSDGTFCFILNVDHLWDLPYFAWAWSVRGRYDLVLGSKRADPTLNCQDQYRRVLSAGLNALLQYLFDSVVADSHGMKLMRTTAAKRLAQACIMRRGQFDTELTLRALREGLWVAEGPVPYQETRPPRNLMIRKIAWNVRDIVRMTRVMRRVPYAGGVNYHRYCRSDLETCASEIQPAVIREGTATGA